MATAAGILSVNAVPSAWTQLPSQACTQIIFQSADYDLAFSATPGANYFHVDSADSNIAFPVVTNANTIWVRAQGALSFYWSS